MDAKNIILVGIGILIGISIRPRRKKHSKHCVNWPVTFFSNNIKITGGITMVSIKYTQLLRGVLGSPVDSKGNETTVEAGSVKFSSSDEEIFTVEKDDKDPDNEVAFKIVGKKPGVAQLNFEADADLGDGVKTISGFTGVEVLPGEAVGFGQPVFGTPEEQPAEETGGGEEGGGEEGGGEENA